MKTIKIFIDKTWERLLVLFGTLSVLLPVSPLNMPLTFRDPGVFLYIGWRILNGELPYRDIWDHKPPVIFYINALGLVLGGGSRWGVWFLELVFLFVAAYLGYKLIKHYFGTFPAVFSLLIWLLSLVGILQGGDFTTEFTLPLQFAALWFLVGSGKLRNNVRFLLIGILGAIAFFTKQTTVGMWVAVVIYLTGQRLFTRQGKQWLNEISWMALGAFGISLLIVGFFAFQNALPQFWSAAFEYNFLYAGRGGAGLAARFNTLLRGLRPLTFTGLIQLGLLGYALALTFILSKKYLPKESVPVLAVVLIDLPIELFLVSITEKTYFHYYMTLLPAFAILTAVAAWGVEKVILHWRFPAWVRTVAALAVLGSFAWSYFDNYLDQTYIYRKNRDDAVIQYVQSNTEPDDKVLLWGAEVSVNFFAKRESPTRFVYQYPLHNARYVTEAIIIEFLDDVIDNRPRYVIQTEYAEPLFSFNLVSDAITEKTAYLQSRYCEVQQIDAWTVYEYCLP